MVLVAAVVGGVVFASSRGTPEPVPPGPGPAATSAAPEPLPEPAPRPAAASLAGAVATAACVAPDSVDSAGNRTTYPAGNAIDGVLTTAWRCRGDGTSQSLTVSFPGPVEVSAVGLVPGLAKTDPRSQVDRYAQNRRISSVRLAFDGGRAVVASLDPSSTNREMQWTAVDPVVTTTVTITVLSSEPGSAQGDFPANDSVAISEIGVR